MPRVDSDSRVELCRERQRVQEKVRPRLAAASFGSPALQGDSSRLQMRERIPLATRLSRSIVPTLNLTHTVSIAIAIALSLSLILALSLSLLLAHKPQIAATADRIPGLQIGYSDPHAGELGGQVPNKTAERFQLSMNDFQR